VRKRPAPFVLAFVAAAVSAQTPGPQVGVGQLDFETYQSALSAERRSIMGANIGLDVAQRERFFALYDAFEKEREPLDRERFGVLQRWAAGQSGLSAPQAMALVRAVAGLQIKEIELRSRHADRIDKAMGGLVGARFYQVDDFVTTATRLNSLQGVTLTR
jgi:hypothetical protein